MHLVESKPRWLSKQFFQCCGILQTGRMYIDSIAPLTLSARDDSHPVQPPVDNHQRVIQRHARAPLEARRSRRNGDDATLALGDNDVAFQRPADDREESIKPSGGNSNRKIAKGADRTIGVLWFRQPHLHYVVYKG